jgi:hypothetical protein
MVNKMILIAHRGNTIGPNHEKENTEDYINEAIKQGYHVETDVWLIENGLFLGHDGPQNPTTLDFLSRENIICHSKTISTFNFLLENGLNCFFHDRDEATLTSRNKIWLYPGVNFCKLGILVMPEWESIDYKGERWIDFVVRNNQNCYGICSDYVELIRKRIKIDGENDTFCNSPVSKIS